MVPLYAARIEDLGPGDFLKVDCGVCCPKAPTEFGRTPLLSHGAAWAGILVAVAPQTDDQGAGPEGPGGVEAAVREAGRWYRSNGPSRVFWSEGIEVSGMGMAVMTTIPDSAASTARSPILSRNNLAILSCFIVFMAFNSILRYIPHPHQEPRVSLSAIGYSLGTGFGSLLFFWLLCKGIEIARRLNIKDKIVRIVMAAIGLVLYVVMFIYIVQITSDLIFIIMAILPLVPAFYFVIGFILGLFSRLTNPGAHATS
jgi:hypothetical protein